MEILETIIRKDDNTEIVLLTIIDGDEIGHLVIVRK